MPPNPPTLASVQQQFAEWRQTRTNLKTPLALKEQAVSLLALHAIGEVCKGLSINHDMMTRWRRELRAAPAPAAEFIELPNASPATLSLQPGADADTGERLELTATRQDADGITLSLRGRLSPSQWQQALQLLERRP